MRQEPHLASLTVSGLSWSPHAHSQFLLDDITCTLEAGTFYGIIGPNGSGKTTLLKHLLRLKHPDDGQIHLEEKALSSYPRQELAKKMALVPQNTHLDSNFIAEEIVRMGRIPYQKRFADLTSTDIALVRSAMELTDSASLRDKPFSCLSGGEAQRVLTARAIAQDTDWLFLDEPISSLDIRHQIDVMDTLSDLRHQQDKTIIAVLHDINMAAWYCSHVIMMKEGKVLYQGPTEEVLTAAHLEDVYGTSFDVVERPGSSEKYFIPKLRQSDLI